MKQAGNDRIKAVIPCSVARRTALTEMKHSWFDGGYACRSTHHERTKVMRLYKVIPSSGRVKGDRTGEKKEPSPLILFIFISRTLYSKYNSHQLSGDERLI